MENNSHDAISANRGHIRRYILAYDKKEEISLEKGKPIPSRIQDFIESIGIPQGRPVESTLTFFSRFSELEIKNKLIEAKLSKEIWYVLYQILHFDTLQNKNVDLDNNYKTQL